MKRMFLLLLLFQIGWTNSSRRSYFYIFDDLSRSQFFHALKSGNKFQSVTRFFGIKISLVSFHEWIYVTTWLFSSLTLEFSLSLSLSLWESVSLSLSLKICFSLSLWESVSLSLSENLFLSLSLSENLFLLNLRNPSETPSYRDTNFLNTFVLSHFRLNLVDNKGRKKGRDLFKTSVPILLQMRHTNPSDTFDFFLFLSSELQKPKRQRETEREREKA